MNPDGLGIGVLDVIRRRRSVRSYLPEPVPRDVIGALLSAAVRAPTAVHEEPWAFAWLQPAPSR